MLLIALAALAGAIAVNCVAVWTQKRHRVYDRLFAERAWTAHIGLLVLVWGVAITLIVVRVLEGTELSWPLPSWVRPFGLVVSLGATLIFGQAIRHSGRRRCSTATSSAAAASPRAASTAG